MADDDELIEATHTANLVSKVHTAQLVHVLRWFVKEGDVEVGELFEQGQADGERSAHLLAPAQLSKSAIDALAAQNNLIIVLPGQLSAAVAHDLTKDAVSFGRDVCEHGFQ